MFSKSQSLIFIIIFWVILVLIITLLSRRKKVTADYFLVSNRNVGLLLGAVSASVAWIWAPALFVASQQAYYQGLPGLFWFTLPNALALVLFAFLATRMRKIFNHGYTLPEFVKQRFDRKTQIIFLITIFIVQIYAVIIQLTGALLLLNLTTGLDKRLLVLLLGAIILTISLLRGIRSSIVTDVIKAFMIAVVVLVLIPFIISKIGGISQIQAGFGGKSGSFTSIFNPSVAWAFGLPISVSLLSGVVIDQQQWQRAFSFKNKTVRNSYFLAAVFFAIIPMVIGLLGFLAANKGLNISVSQPQLAGFAVVMSKLPRIGVALFVLMVLAALIASGSAALSAASSIGAIDLYKSIKKKIDNNHLVTISRITMIIIAVLGMSIALIPNIQILYLQLLVGAFRSALMIPTILALFWSRLSAKFTFWGIILGMAIGIPLFIYGSIIKNTTISSVGSLVPIAITLAACIISSFATKEKFEYAKLVKANS